jgi:hypothetical protein
MTIPPHQNWYAAAHFWRIIACNPRYVLPIHTFISPVKNGLSYGQKTSYVIISTQISNDRITRPCPV